MAADPARAKSVFLIASDLTDPAERAAYLDRECGDDADLRARVEALLRADAAPPAAVPDATAAFNPDAPATAEFNPGAAATGAFDPSAVPGPPAGPARDAGAGTVIAGRYALVETVGEGGMGTVWRARQIEPVKRSVAVKLIRAGMNSKQVLARFEAERQALALMDHPNIATVYDGGVHDGRPFFVMELVDGVPITDYCDVRRLTPEERLRLFVPVCEAIQHAHQKGVIHRDIKPSNVLVAVYDGRPVVKVIDFGVAKATGGALTDATIDTGLGGVVGTPQYMSPEQATFNNLDIDTRSDVYSLGVLLYELLTGSPPFSPTELARRGLMEILRVVREEEPPRPSTRVSTAEGLPSLAANRGTEPRKLTGMLRNELDWIVMKALEKDRTRRYETATGFAADLNRYLTGEAILAHPPSRAYRLKKFVRRHKQQVVAAGLVLLTLVAGVVGSTLGWLEARRARVAETARADAERRERERAERAEAEATDRAKELKQVAEFQAEMLDRVDTTAAGKRLTQDVVGQLDAALAREQVPDAERARQVQQFRALWERVNATETVWEVIDQTILRRAVTALDAKFRDQPLVDARLRETIASIYVQLAKYRANEPLVARALDTRRRHLGNDHPLTLRSLGQYGMALFFLGDKGRAEAVLREALASKRRVLGDDHESTVAGINHLSLAVEGDPPSDECLALSREFLAACERKYGRFHEQTCVARNNLGHRLGLAGRPADAEALFRAALGDAAGAKDEVGQTIGEDHQTPLILRHHLGVVLHQQGRFAEAEEVQSRNLAHLRRAWGETHPVTLLAYDQYCVTLLRLGKSRLTESLAKEAVALRTERLGKDHLHTLYAVRHLGAALLQQGKYAEALALLEPTEAATRKHANLPHQVGRHLLWLGQARAGLKRYADAERALLEAEPLLVKTRVRAPGYDRECWQALADLYTATNKPDEANKHRGRLAKDPPPDGKK